MLLKPRAIASTLRELSERLFEPASLACAVLGERACAIRIRKLMGLGDPDLRREACRFLAVQLRDRCAW